MNKESIILEIKHECSDFSSKTMEIYKEYGIMIEFSVYDPEEMRKDCE